jgi:hypothetical protein
MQINKFNINIKKSFLALLITAPLCILFANGQAVKRLYIANDDHTDYMWAGNVQQYDSAFVKCWTFILPGSKQPKKIRTTTRTVLIATVVIG